MKLKVITYFWAVGKRTKRIKTNKYKFDDNYVSFVLNRLPSKASLGESVATIEINNLNGELIKTISLKKGEKAYYRPLSMDGGYEYIFKICRF